MSIYYNIQAEVVDICSDTPKKDDIFLVDTNVWYWLAYSQASHPLASSLSYQIKHYPTYLKNALSFNSHLKYCGLSLAEVAHLIEKTEREIFNSMLKSKEYRHNHPKQRAKVVAEIQAAWGIVAHSAVSLDIPINETTTNAALTRLQTQPLDGYDLFILEAMKKENVKQVITDDGDYCTVPGIIVFTANKNVINAAKAKKKLKKR
ncbi:MULTISPECIES: hypothetical protein [Spirulina sp. CCY15215]|uniref:hypothetical protein n=1 Tax=Spirulina sp. CCY15215 TaxID=2767591 RepID=UPI00194E86BC|nr:hypothetical protein [Spirulina major]